MPAKPVWFVVDLAIKPNALPALEALARQMVDLTLREQGALVYEFFLSPDRSRCTVVEQYADEAAVLAHLTGPVVQTLVPKALEHASVERFAIFGDPGPDATPILNSLAATIYPHLHGFTR